MDLFTTLLAAASLQFFSVIDSMPHNTDYYTQGLSFDKGVLLESTGRYGESGIYRYNKNFVIQDSMRLEDRYFGEGSVSLGQDIFFLTWKSKKVFKLDSKTLKIKQTLKIPTEGWGLTFCKGLLWLSDGSSEIFKVSPEDFRYIGSLKVQDSGKPLPYLNELECIDGTIYANIWQSDSIAVIDIKNGNVLKYLDFSTLAQKTRKKFPKAEVLNGIAYDGKFLWITGKWWPFIYKIILDKN